MTGEGDGINGGIGGGRGHQPNVLFCVDVPDVESALQKAESLGGSASWVLSRSPGISRSGASSTPKAM